MVIPPHFLAALSQRITDCTMALLPMGSCIIVYTIREWNKWCDTLRSEGWGDKLNPEKYQHFWTSLIDSVVHVEINSSGEIILPQSIYKKMNLEREIAFVMGSDSIYVMKIEDTPGYFKRMGFLDK